MDNKIEQYRQLTHSMNKIIHTINVDFNKETVTKNSLDALDKLEKENKEYIKLCKEIKDNKFLYKETDINIVNRDMMAYKNMILNAKKIMIYYYNQKIYELNKRLNTIKVIVSSHDSFDMTLLNSVKIPEYIDRFISNYQDKINVDFEPLDKISNDIAKIEEKLSIVRKSDKLFKMDYIENYVLDKIESNINNYGIDKNITRVSIENDIFWVSYELDSLKKSELDEYHPSRLTYIEGKLDFLKDLLSKKRVGKNSSDNEEYYILKEKINLFYREVSEYHLRIQEKFEQITDDKVMDIKNKLIALQSMYNKLPDKIKNDKVLNGSLQTAFDKLKTEIREFIKDSKQIIAEEQNNEKEPEKEDTKVDTNVETEKKPEATKIVEEAPAEESTPNSEDSNVDYEFELVGTRDGSEVYKKFQKHVLISASLATLALLIPSISSFILPAILVQNVALAYGTPIMNKINNIIGKSIGAKKSKDGTWYNSHNQPITRMSALSGLLKSLVVNGVGKSTIVTSIANRIKSSGNAIPTPDFDYNKVTDYSIDVEKLYAEYVRSNMRFADFCKSQSLDSYQSQELAAYAFRQAEAPAKERGK